MTLWRWIKHNNDLLHNILEKVLLHIASSKKFLSQLECGYFHSVDFVLEYYQKISQVRNFNWPHFKNKIRYRDLVKKMSSIFVELESVKTLKKVISVKILFLPLITQLIFCIYLARTFFFTKILRRPPSIYSPIFTQAEHLALHITLVYTLAISCEQFEVPRDIKL